MGQQTSTYTLDRAILMGLYAHKNLSSHENYTEHSISQGEALVEALLFFIWAACTAAGQVTSFLLDCVSLKLEKCVFSCPIF
ncbi:MAG TPA: hypothetical protein IAA28_04950, partial [Candidatus Lachnoclostridium stercoripullorum]|nr:hypothetical protein [Candidatus Lachnoclostridium stercoripullorum]